MTAAETMTTQIGTDHLANIYLRKVTITVEPLANHIKCKTARTLLGYRDIVNMDAPLWTNSTCNELGCLS